MRYPEGAPGQRAPNQPPNQQGAREKRAIIVGASSGIGRALAFELAQRGYRLGLCARRSGLLEELRRELGTGFGRQYDAQHCVIRALDVSVLPQARDELEALIEELGGVDLGIVSAGTGHLNPELDWELDDDTLCVNVRGFTAVAGLLMRRFLDQGSGHLVTISSLAARRGLAVVSAYNASKAYVSNYAEGLRCTAKKSGLPISVTDVQPGLVDTAMAKSDRPLPRFWLRPPAQAARQIARAIDRRRRLAVVTRRYRPLGWLMKWTPGWIWERFT